MNKQIGERIRRIRAAKGLSQANVAHDLGITGGAYAKIERGETDANASRLIRIAEVLEVNICEFFDEHYASRHVMEPRIPYGYATKDEMERLQRQMQTLLNEIERLKAKLDEKEEKEKKEKRKHK